MVNLLARVLLPAFGISVYGTRWRTGEFSHRRLAAWSLRLASNTPSSIPPICIPGVVVPVVRSLYRNFFCYREAVALVLRVMHNHDGHHAQHQEQQEEAGAAPGRCSFVVGVVRRRIAPCRWTHQADHYGDHYGAPDEYAGQEDDQIQIFPSSCSFDCLTPK